MKQLRNIEDLIVGVLVGLAVIFTVVWVAAPAQAADDQCMRINITRTDTGSPLIESIDQRGVQPGDIRTSVVGYYAWFTWFNEEDFPSDSDDTVSVDVSDPSVVAVEACLDGAITVVTAQPEPVKEPEEEPEEELTTTTTTPSEPSEPVTPTITLPDPEEWCRIFPMQLRIYCSLSNRIIQAVIAGLIN